jgi:hypothetical protein
MFFFRDDIVQPENAMVASAANALYHLHDRLAPVPAKWLPDRKKKTP